MTKKTRVVFAVVSLLAVLAIWFGVGLYSRVPKSPELAIQAFYEQDVAEDQIMDPLILAGPSVVPLLQDDLANPDMPRRRYAIGALGNLKSEAALPTLEQLARAESEVDYIRCDALAAIAMIDHQQGLRVANDVEGEGPPCLSEVAEELQRDYVRWLKSTAPRRTYLQALMGRHS